MVSTRRTASSDSALTKQSSELAATYAALILADDGVEITVSYFHQFTSTSPEMCINAVLHLSLSVPNS